MTMVHGTVHLDDGETVIIMAEDMLSALKLATKRYHGKARRMDFMTVDEQKVFVEWKQPPEVMILNEERSQEMVTLNG